jgi:PTS system glucose-specific IIC component
VLIHAGIQFQKQAVVQANQPIFRNRIAVGSAPVNASYRSSLLLPRADKARQVIAALGGASNIQRVDACAETRLRLVVGNEGSVDEGALQAAGVTGVMRLANHTLHLIIGLNADQYAAEMQGQLAGP